MLDIVAQTPAVSYLYTGVNVVNKWNIKKYLIKTKVVKLANESTKRPKDVHSRLFVWQYNIKTSY